MNLAEVDMQLLRLLNLIITMENSEVKYSRAEATQVFLNKQDLVNVLDDRRTRQFSRPIFERLHEFVSNRIALEF